MVTRRDLFKTAVLAGVSLEAANFKGNLGVQLLATGGASSLQEVRAIIDRSFPTEVFSPQESDKWDREAKRFQHYCGLVYD